MSLLFLGAGLLPSHTFQYPQYPQGKGKEALQPEQPKKCLRLFGTNVYVDQPLEAPHASGISSARPVSELQCDPRTWQGLSSDQSWKGHSASGIGHSHCEQSSRRLEYLPHEQGTSRSMGPHAKGTLVAKYTSSAAQEQSSFMPGASRVAPPQPLRQQGSRMRPFKEVEAENVLDDVVREEATRNRLMMISLDIAQWKFERELVRKYGGRRKLVEFLEQAASGQYGTLRIGIKSKTEQGLYDLPLPRPMWNMELKKLFLERAGKMLYEQLKTDNRKMKDIDSSYGRCPTKVREEVFSEQLRWFMTAEEIQSKDDQEKIAKLSKDASPEYQSKYKKLKSKDQQGAPSASDIMQSDRFIPPSPNPGAKVYRTPSQSDVVGKKFEFKGSHIPS